MEESLSDMQSLEARVSSLEEALTNVFDHVARLSAENAALSQTLLSFGKVLNAEKIVPDGILTLILTDIDKTLSPDVKARASSPLSVLALWRTARG